MTLTPQLVKNKFKKYNNNEKHYNICTWLKFHIIQKEKIYIKLSYLLWKKCSYRKILIILKTLKLKKIEKNTTDFVQS